MPDTPLEPIIDYETYAPLIYVRTPPTGDNPYWSVMWINPNAPINVSWSERAENDEPLYIPVGYEEN